MDNIKQIQSMLDENKQNMPEDVYLKFCTKMKDMYTEQKDLDSDEAGIYEIEYDIIGLKPRRCTNTFILDTTRKTRLIELTAEEFNTLSVAELHNLSIDCDHTDADIIRKIDTIHEHMFVKPNHNEIKNLDLDECFPSDAEDIEETIRDSLAIHLLVHKSINIISLKKY